MKTIDRLKRLIHKNSQSLQNDQGIALVTSLVLGVIILSLVPVTMLWTTDDFTRTANYAESRTAFYIADAGINHAKNFIAGTTLDTVLAGPDGNKSSTADNGTTSAIGSATTWNSLAYRQVAFNNGTYNIRFTDNADDADDWDDSDQILVVESVGVTAAGTTSTIKATIHKWELDPGAFPAAVTLVGPVSTISTGGNGFNVHGGSPNGWTTTGFDSNTSQVQDTSCTGMNALATESTAAATDTSGMNQTDNFEGVSGGDPDILYSNTTFQSADAQELYDMFKPLATGGVTGIHAGESDPSDPSTYTAEEVVNGVTLGTLANPQVTYYDGNIKVNGSVTGAGVLIVDGNMSISGSLDFAGVILIGSCTTCWGELVGTGGAEIYGAMVVGNNVDAIANFTGSAEIYYSCDGISTASGVMNQSVRTVSWNEEK